MKNLGTSLAPRIYYYVNHINVIRKALSIE